VLRAHCFHPFVLCCVALGCAHAAESDDKDQPSQTASKTTTTTKKVRFREEESHHLRPFIFKMGTLGPPAPNTVPPKSPARFNPDPGKWNSPATDHPVPPPAAPGAATPNPGAAVPVTSPSGNLAPDFSVLFPSAPIQPPILPTASEVGVKVPSGLELPRRKVRGRGVIDERWEYPEYPLGREGLGLLPNTKPLPNRWFIDFPHWQRYLDPATETPYQYDTPRLWHPYEQSLLKGDVPVIGQDIFVVLTAKNFTLFEARKLPVGSGVSAALPNSSEFFGRGDQLFINNDTSFTAEIFKGETAFKPVNWALRVTGVYNQNFLWVNENNLVDPDPRGSDYVESRGGPNTGKINAIPSDGKSVNVKPGLGAVSFNNPQNPGDVFNYLAPQLDPLGNAKTLKKVDPATNSTSAKGKDSGRNNDLAETRTARRFKEFFALQEAFAEVHISDLSNNYDFISMRAGIQPFNSDFRGFIFSDTNLAFRVFGNLDNNRVQYNAAIFDMLEKDTYSDLNTFDSRDQKVLILNVFKQDFFAKGYTTQFSFHGNFDDGGVHYDKNGFITRPAPVGTIRTVDNSAVDHLRGKDVNAYYLGWTGDGHIGRLNITHAFYQVFGEDSFNEIAGRRVSINAQMAAAELSYDHDYIRFKLSGFYASGDSNPTDGTARGFDSIQDNPFFIGGPFSWYTHQGFNLAGTGVNLKQRDSLVTDLRTSKTEGQSNFVNPGVWIVGAGIDTDITPKLKGFMNANYIWLDQTKVIEELLFSNKISNALGLDLSFGFRYRPLLTDNIIFQAGVGFFLPGPGYKSIYRKNTDPVPGFGPQHEAGSVDNFLYNAFFTVTLVY
jgi:hypothetical protein